MHYNGFTLRDDLHLEVANEMQRDEKMEAIRPMQQISIIALGIWESSQHCGKLGSKQVNTNHPCKSIKEEEEV
jgi:hypothetical protein